MKQKSLHRPGLTFLKIHVFVFVLFTLGMSANIFLTLNHPTNMGLPFSTFTQLIMQSVSVTFMWGIVLLAHLAFHQLRAFSQYRAQAAHAEEIEAIQERYVSAARLDMDAQGVSEDDIIHEDMPHAERRNDQRIKTR
jgi:hypothetical protein